MTGDEETGLPPQAFQKARRSGGLDLVFALNNQQPHYLFQDLSLLGMSKTAYH